MSQARGAPQMPAGTNHVERAGKYLTFHLGQEQFGIEVLKVREIMGVQEITAVPQMPSWIKGVINLRGKIIPVIDLRLKFGMPAPYNQRTCIIVVQLTDRGEQILLGVIVDDVSEVVNIAAGEIEDVPAFGFSLPTPYILGLAKQKNGVKILLDIDQVLTASDREGVHAARGAGEAQ
jgi:purine-binding chemotaxis protein CheW